MPSTYSRADVSDSYGQWTYNDDLIYFAVENHDNWQDRELALKKDHFIKIYIKRLDEEIFAEKPICKPDIFGMQEKNKDLKLMNGETIIEDETVEAMDISEEWELEKWTDLFIKIMNKARIHSKSVVQLYDGPPYWRVFSDREITKIEYDENDIPISCDVEWSRELPHSDKYRTFKETCVFYDPTKENNDDAALLVPFGIPESDDRLGEYDLEDKWTLDIALRYATLAVINNSSKTSGFYWCKYGEAISPETKALLDKAFDMAGSSSGIGAKGSQLDTVTAMFPQNPEFTILAVAEFIRRFASACRLPSEYFRSEAEKGGGFWGEQGATEDIRVNKKKLHLFGTFKNAFMTLIQMRWGIILDDIQPYILEAEQDEINIPLNKEKEQHTDKKEVIK